MSTDNHIKIIDTLDSVEELYHRLVLVVGKMGCGKTETLKEVAHYFGTHVINVNLALSSALLEMTARQRTLRLPEIMDQIVGKERSPVILDNLEILFDKNLKQDPLRLLQGISRNRSVVASWKGTITGGKLIYAEAGHPEYRSYDLTGLTVVGMEETIPVDSEKSNREAGQV